MAIGVGVSTKSVQDPMRQSRSSRRHRKKMTVMAFCLAASVDVSAAFSLSRRFSTRRIMALRQTSTSLAFQNNGQEPFAPKEQKQNKFRITAPYPPAADQPKAIREICQRVQNGDKFSILRGCTGTGKFKCTRYPHACLFL